ncbi:MAG: hypothetical protein OJF49_004157 [Ktedonobacterales bacterium]|nr:MAG: hypothetical protein OJF49_004157 [Ktedonobacterales bacterium]
MLHITPANAQDREQVTLLAATLQERDGQKLVQRPWATPCDNTEIPPYAPVTNV